MCVYVVQRLGAAPETQGSRHVVHSHLRGIGARLLASDPCRCTCRQCLAGSPWPLAPYPLPPQNAQSSDCAKGRVGLCAASDPACLAFQSYSDPASAQTLASYLSANCPVPLAPGAGVLATLRFADTSVSTYLSSGYEQGVANALAGAAGVPSSDVQTLDVRPVVGRRRRARALLQSGAGVQATYYVASSDPDATLAALKTAADDGSLTNALNANGISGTPTATLQAIYASDCECTMLLQAYSKGCHPRCSRAERHVLHACASLHAMLATRAGLTVLLSPLLPSCRAHSELWPAHVGDRRHCGRGGRGGAGSAGCPAVLLPAPPQGRQGRRPLL